MILLLGATGYIGEAFARELTRRKNDFIPLSRKQVDYTRFDLLLEFLKAKKPAFVVNAAGYTGKPNVDACELHKADTLQAGQTRCFRRRLRTRARRREFSGAMFRPAAFIPAQKFPKMERRARKKISRNRNCVRSSKILRIKSTASRRRTRRIFPSATARAVFTVARKRWVKRRLPALDEATSGGCGFHLMNLTMRAIT